MVQKALLTSNSGEWETPQDFFDTLDERFGFTVDVCATSENKKCDKYFGLDKLIDGLEQDWTGHTC